MNLIGYSKECSIFCAFISMEKQMLKNCFAFSIGIRDKKNY